MRVFLIKISGMGVYMLINVLKTCTSEKTGNGEKKGQKCVREEVI